MNNDDELLDSAPEQDELFARQLSHAMRQARVPSDFKEIVLRRIAAEHPARTLSARLRAFVIPTMRHPWLTAGLAAGLVFCICFGELEHIRYIREQATVERQYEIANQITENALQRTRDELLKAGIDDVGK